MLWPNADESWTISQRTASGVGSLALEVPGYSLIHIIQHVEPKAATATDAVLLTGLLSGTPTSAQSSAAFVVPNGFVEGNANIIYAYCSTSEQILRESREAHTNLCYDRPW